jgi:hypothetical protein
MSNISVDETGTNIEVVLPDYIKVEVQDQRVISGPQGPIGPKSVTISYPTAIENMTLLYAKQTLKIARVSSVLVGNTGSTVSFTIKKSAQRNAAGTEIITGGMVCDTNSSADVVTVFNDNTVQANTFLWLETTEITGSVTEFHLTIDFS